MIWLKHHETLLHFYKLGARYIQLDDTTWAYLIARLLDDPENHEKYVKMCEDIVYVVNKLLQGLPEDLRVSTHICRGNFKSTYLLKVPMSLSQNTWDNLTMVLSF